MASTQLLNIVSPKKLLIMVTAKSMPCLPKEAVHFFNRCCIIYYSKFKYEDYILPLTG